MDGVVKEVLFEWRDTGQYKKAETRLIDLFDEKSLPEYIDRDVCRLKQLGLFRHLKCEWQVRVVDPVLGETFLQFTVYKYLNAEGLLEENPRNMPNHTIGTI